MAKPYDVGLICGRFQTFHEGHETLVNTGLDLCDRILILVGSSQEQNTERNPLDVSRRIDMIKEVYGDNANIMIHDIPDKPEAQGTEWGRYVLEIADKYVHKVPEVMISGNDEDRKDWFAEDDVRGMIQVILDRSNLPISATQLREMMINDRRKEWMSWVHPRLHKMYDELRSELVSINS